MEVHMIHGLTRAFSEARTLLLIGPLDLDGDAVGAIAAVARAVSLRWPECHVRLVADEALPARYRFLEDPAQPFLQAADVPVEPTDLAVVLDGDPARLGAATPHFLAARKRAMIDHHKTAERDEVDEALLDPAAASTTELVLQLCDHWGVPLDRPLAAAIYAGLVFDTHVFRYRLTRPPTLRAAARLMETGIDHAFLVERVLLDQPMSKMRLRGRMLDRMHVELEGRLVWAALDEAECNGVETGGLVDDLVFIEGTEVGMLLVDRAGGRVKLSLRSRGGVDCAQVAQAIAASGGGHARAAGATVEGSAAGVAQKVLAEVQRQLS
jgi:phosphoesterase RecJ-like protein